MGIISVYSPEKNYRPKCVFTLHSGLLGSLSNSNFDYSNTDYDAQNNSDIVTLSNEFYLTDMPSLSFSSDLDTNNGAKLAEKLAGFGEGKVMGINFGEIIQNNNLNNSNVGGFRPAFVLDGSSFKVVKGAKKLNVTLKTRIPCEPEIPLTEQRYVNLLFTLIGLSLPTDKQKVESGLLKSSIDNFLGGTGEAISNLGDAVIGSDLKARDLAGVMKEEVRAVSQVPKAISAKNAMEFNEVEQNVTNSKKKIGEKSGQIANSLTKILDSVVKSYIYREYITIEITRNGNNIVDYKDIKFILKNFKVSQSNQLYGNTLAPIYMDFEINLESLGVVVTGMKT